MNSKYELENRMKKFYEEIPKNRLMRRCPVIIRLDGKSFHTLIKGLKKPFDDIFRNAMNDTMLYLCKNIQGCELGYTQSDEITLLLIDYKTLNSDAWFDYEVEKICSVSASMATLSFNKAFEKYATQYIRKEKNSTDIETIKYIKLLKNVINKGGCFDSRCFNVPKEEVCNLFYWRQLDCIRNSVLAVGQYYFTAKELHGKGTSDIKEMLIIEKYVDWNNYNNEYKVGVSCYKTKKINDKESWVLDKNMPILRNVDNVNNRDYVEKYVYLED